MIRELAHIARKALIKAEMHDLSVDPILLAAAQGVACMNADASPDPHAVAEMGDASAMLKSDDVIYYRSGCAPIHIAHELGHYLRKHTKDGPFEETEAELLGMMLLIHPAILRCLPGDKAVHVMRLTGCGIEKAQAYINKVKLCFSPFDMRLARQFGVTDLHLHAILAAILLVFGIGVAVGVGSAKGIGTRYVYVTSTGGKYHYNSNCVGGEVRVPLKLAEDLRLSPCLKCASNDQ